MFNFTKILSSAFFLLTLTGAPLVSAQESELTILAQIAVSEASVVQEGTALTATFTLTNGADTLQPDVRYGMELWSVSADQSIPSTRTYVVVSDTIQALPAHTTLQETFETSVPGVLTGLYRVRIVAETTSGLSLGSATAGTIRLSGEEGVMIDQSSCTAHIEGTDTSYTTSQGVDMTEGETLLLSCAVDNSGDATTLSPRFVTTLRSLYGEQVETTTGDAISIPTGESTVTFTIPTPTTPQAYDTTVTLRDDSTVLSNTVSLHYVIQGASATIQNITLDKTTYQEGDIATATLFVTGIAGSFPNARTESGTLSNPTLIAKLHSQSDIACAEEVATPLADLEDSGAAFTDIVFPVTRTCPNATVSLEVKDDSGVLTSHTAVTTTQENTTTLSFVALIILVLIAGVIIYLVSRAGKSVPAAFVLIGVGGLLVFGGSVGAEEEKIASSLTVTSGIVTAQISLDKSVYMPGEPIVVSTDGAHFSSCLNLMTSNFAAFSWAIDNPNATFIKEDPTIWTGLMKFFGLADFIDVEHGLGAVKDSSERDYFYYVNTMDILPFMNEFVTLEEVENVVEKIDNFIAAYVSGDVPYRTSYYSGAKNAPSEPGVHEADVFIEKLRNPFIIDLSTGDSFLSVARAIIKNDFNEEHFSIPFEVLSGTTPSITLTATPSIVYEGDDTTLSWTPLHVVSCVASADPALSTWEGSVTAETSDSTIVGPLTAEEYVFSLSCLGTDGSIVEDSVLLYTEPVIYPECSDNADNDGDNWIDEADPGCFTDGVYDPNDDDETNTTPDCSDGKDNDGDHQSDGFDPGCSSGHDTAETGEPTDSPDDANDSNGDSSSGDGIGTGTSEPDDETKPDDIDFSEF